MGCSGWGGSSPAALLGHRLRGRWCAVRAPWVLAGNISSGDGRNEILLLFHPLSHVGWGDHEDLTPATDTQTVSERVRRGVNVSRVPPWGKADARGKNKKVRTAATIVPAFPSEAAGDAAAMARTMHQGRKPLVPRRILARRTKSRQQSATPRAHRWEGVPPRSIYNNICLLRGRNLLPPRDPIFL